MSYKSGYFVIDNLFISSGLCLVFFLELFCQGFCFIRQIMISVFFKIYRLRKKKGFDSNGMKFEVI